MFCKYDLYKDKSLAKQPNPFTALNNWYGTPLGRALAAQERYQLEAVLPRLFGYHLLQLGVPFQSDWLSYSPIRHQICMHEEEGVLSVGCIGEFSLLPFKSDSIDVVILPHILSLVDNPQALLEEATRVLIPEGHLVILGFNPVSLWGAARLILKYKKQVPWTGDFITAQKVRRLLNKIGCNTLSLNSFAYRPPINNSNTLDKLLFLESFGQLFWPYPGSAYILHAQKRISRLTPITESWRLPGVSNRKKITQPTARISGD